jgi:nicotinate phosphoribosyltransferase
VTTDAAARRQAPSNRAAGQLPAGSGTGLLTDHYELTMVRAALEGGAAGRRAVFEVFARQLPRGRRYGVVAGTGRFLDALAAFSFDATEIDYLRSAGVVDERTAGYLASYRFGGSIWGYPEGECYFPGSPILVVEGTFAEAVILETLALSIFNHDCAVASAASRMITAAGQRPIIEMGSRRTHERAAVAAARASYLAGFASTSNLRAGLEYGVPTTGTSAHAFTLVHDDERQAFTVQLDALGVGTTLLVDTYDVATAVRTAVELAGPGLGAVRIDSGDVAAVARQVRAQLDALGATRTRIVVTGDLDEHAIDRLAGEPIDGYGVGTALVTGSGAPTAALVYKLVAREGRWPAAGASPASEAGAGGAGAGGAGTSGTGTSGARAVDGRAGDGRAGSDPLLPVAKRSVGKPTMGGRKWAARRYRPDGIAVGEVISGFPPADRDDQRALLRPLVIEGEIVGAEPLAKSRARHQRAVAELPAAARLLTPGSPAIPTILEPGDMDWH